MIREDTDKTWKEFGNVDPYFGVLSDTKYQKKNLSKRNKQEFFRTGDKYIAAVLKTAEQHLGPVNRRRALDFGCGVGRLTIPLAREFKQAVGVDISEGMLAEARKNCKEFNVRNCRFVTRIDKQKYDLIHSYITLQHIDPSRGYKIIEQMVEQLAPDGVGILHVIFFIREPARMRMARKVIKHVGASKYLLNLYARRPLNYPIMQMNQYDLKYLSVMLHKHGVHGLYIAMDEYTGDYGETYYSATLYFRK